jgi:dTMP kinase
MAGIFISLDGVDGCGKSTQIAKLRDWLEGNGKSVLSVRDPGATKLGEALREILLHRTEIPLVNTAEMLLYMASRAQLVQERIIPALDQESVVISDRYLLANVVYQGTAGGIQPELIWQVGQVATAGRMPDLTIVLDLDPQIAFQRMRGQPDRLESRGIEYMSRVREGFLTQAEHLGNQVMIVQANQSIEAIHEIIVAEVSKRFFATSHGNV